MVTFYLDDWLATSVLLGCDLSGKTFQETCQRKRLVELQLQALEKINKQETLELSAFNRGTVVQTHQ